MTLLLQQIIESQMLERLEKRPNEMEGMWKEADLVHFQVPFRDLSGGLRKATKT